MMKAKCLPLIFSLLSCSSIATNDNIPTGEVVFNALFSQFNSSLVGEPLCQTDERLQDLLALSLSVSMSERTKTHVSTTCESSKAESVDNKVLDVWDCTVNFLETDDSDVFISSSSYVIALSKVDLKFVRGSLRCR